MNPYTQEKSYAYLRQAQKCKVQEQKKKKEKQNIKDLISVSLAILFLAYLFIMPPLNPLRYTWERVTVSSGDTAYELQEQYAPNGNTRLLMIECSLKNIDSLGSLQPGDVIYVLKEK